MVGTEDGYNFFLSNYLLKKNYRENSAFANLAIPQHLLNTTAQS